MKKLVPKHPLAIRWMHWINFPVLFAMIWSGLLIYWANDVFKVRVGHNIVYSFFPDGFYRTLGLSRRLAEGMAFHFVFMWIFFVNGVAYVLYTLLSGEWRQLFPNKHSFREAWLVLLHDLHIRKTAPPQGKFNAAQRIAYTGIIFMGFLSILTGLAIYKPVQFHWLAVCFGGYATARIIHFILTGLYCIFFLVHVVQVILAGWNNFRAMVTGWEVVDFPHKPADALTTTPLSPPPVPIAPLPPPPVLIAPLPTSPVAAPPMTPPSATPIPVTQPPVGSPSLALPAQAPAPITPLNLAPAVTPSTLAPPIAPAPSAPPTQTQPNPSHA